MTTRTYMSLRSCASVCDVVSVSSNWSSSCDSPVPSLCIACDTSPKPVKTFFQIYKVAIKKNEFCLTIHQFAKIFFR